jgi:catechol 2,3-dioxygenase-like lactoylglutathione lyase family enzyme
MLKNIVIITISVFQLGPVETAFQEHLGYTTVERGSVSEALGRAWDAPASAGHDYALMRPASGAEVYLRFVEGPELEGYEPLRNWGWNATELLVTDPDALAARLQDSPFEIIGPPKDLWNAPDAPRALQTLGPGNEVLYLTRNGSFETRSEVDRVFIMVVGGPSMAALRDFYGGRLGLRVGDATPFQISVLSRAQGLPADTTYPLAIATVSDDFLIELDEYPTTAGSRPISAGHLPPGTAMVTFEVDSLDRFDLSWRAEARAVDDFPYAGRRAAVTIGPAGEWIELIETATETE